MGFKAEKEITEKKVKRAKLIALLIVVFLLIGFLVFSLIVPPNTWQYRVSNPDIAERKDGELRLHFIDVGQGDCTLIELPDGKTMLIDGGNGTDSTEKAVLRYLNALDIDYIDYLVVTHADSDHCGSLDAVLGYVDVGMAYIPPIMPNYANNEYAAFYSELMELGIPKQYGSRNVVLSQEGTYPYTLAFLHPKTIDTQEEALDGNKSEDNNDLSSVVWLDYHGASALFTGDISNEIETMLVQEDMVGAFDKRGVDLQSTEILKVAHHGSNTSNSSEFLQYIGVKTSIISCGSGNAYGHPNDNVLSNLSVVGANTYRTDVHGNIMVTISSNGTYSISKIA